MGCTARWEDAFKDGPFQQKAGISRPTLGMAADWHTIKDTDCASKEPQTTEMDLGDTVG